jgi:hypothetical protein
LFEQIQDYVGKQTAEQFLPASEADISTYAAEYGDDGHDKSFYRG